MMSTLNNPESSQKFSSTSSNKITLDEAAIGSAGAPLKQRFTLGFANVRLLAYSCAAAILMAVSTLFLLSAPAMAAPTQQTTPLPLTLTINNEVEPATADDLFDLQLNGQTVKESAGNGDTTGALLLPIPSTYTVTVLSATEIPLDAYETTLVCVNTRGETLVNELTTSAAIEVGLDSGASCTFSHVRRPAFVATLNDTLLIDTDAETNPGTSPGDTIQLQTIITKVAGITGTNVIFSIPIDENSTIVSDTLTTTQGVIDQGSSSEDGVVRVMIGNVSDETSVVITWNVMINSPLPANVDTVRFQGQVSSDNGPSVATDDPSIPALADPTEISVTAKPLLNVTHLAVLLIDADNNQKISAGDRVYYEVVVINIGNGPAYNLIVEGAIDPNTELITTSLTATQGSVSSDGNNIRLTAGTLEGGAGRVTMNYHVVVDNDIAATSISSQFEASADPFMSQGERIRVLSDDPKTLEAGDATVASVAPSTASGIYLPYINSPQVTR